MAKQNNGVTALVEAISQVDPEDQLSARGMTGVRDHFAHRNLIVVLAVLSVYLLVALVVFGRFESKQWYPVTGDEPHYLVMTSGIIHDHTLEQTLPYEQEFRNRSIYPQGLAPAGAITTPANAAVFKGPHGLFNYHDAGLPILLVPGFALDGVVGSKIEMIVLLGLAAISASWLALKVIGDRRIALLVALATTLGLPLLPTASQIYPDLLNGSIALLLCAIYIVGKDRRTIFADIGIAVLAGIEPWLHIKFLAPALVLVVAFGIRFIRARHIARLVMFVGIFGAFLLLLGYYNWYAFGSVLGPYTGGVNVGPKGTIMALVGLFIDRHQGIFAQQPLFVLGAFWTVRGLVRRQSWALVVSFVVFSIMLPGAAFTNVYGGYSFAGRFEWGGAMVLIAPTILFLATLYQSRRRTMYGVIFAAALLQGAFGLEYLAHRFDFYNVVGNTWLTQYPSLWGPLAKFMPALYDQSWAFGYVPNYIGAALLGLVLIAGIFSIRRLLVVLFGIGFASLFLVGEAVAQPAPPEVFAASTLQSQIGVISGNNRIASPGDVQGTLTYGPYVTLGPGEYTFTLKYLANSATESSSSWDMVCGVPNSGALVRLSGGILMPSIGDKFSNLTVPFLIPPGLSPCIVQVRTDYGGKGTLDVSSLVLRQR